MNLCVSNSLSSLHIYIAQSAKLSRRERERETSRVARVTNKRYGGLFAFQHHHHHHHRDHHREDISKAQKTLAQKRRGFGRDLCGGFGSRPKSSSSSSSFSGGAAWQKPPPPQSKIGVVPGGGGLGGGDDDDDERQRMDRHRM